MGKSKSDTRPSHEQLFLEYLEGVLTGNPITLPVLGKKHGYSPDSIRNVSSKNHWKQKIQEALLTKSARTESAIIERERRVIERLENSPIDREVAVRKRHTVVARALQTKALERLQNIPLDQLEAKDAIQMLKLGLAEERKALGLSETAVQQSGTDYEHAEEMKSAVDEALSVLEQLPRFNEPR